MKKNNAILVMIALIFFTAIGWYAVFNNKAEMQKQYDEYINLAKKFEEKEIYVDALDNYRSALELNPNDYDITMKMAEMYYKLGDKNGFIEMNEAAIKINPSGIDPYLDEAKYYLEIADYKNALNVTERAEKWIQDNEELNSLISELSVKAVNKYVSFERCMDWHVQDDGSYIPAYLGDKWGLIDSNGMKKIQPKFDYLGAYDCESGVLPACLEGEWYYIDLKGYKKLVGDNKYQFGNGLAPAQKNNSYGYIDKDFNEQKFEFNFAGSFANNVAAVQKGNKWAIIDNKLNEITGFDYDEIKTDTYGYCSMYGIIAVKAGNVWSLIDLSGKPISNDTFEEVKLPASKDEPVAVMKNKKWGYVDSKGAVVIEPKYDDAYSFSLGLAPVKVNNKWGYINLKNALVIDSVYEEAYPFSSDGRAVINDGYFYDFIVLCKYDG